MSELKPCPFCGSGYIDTGCLTVGCCRCGANGPEGYEGTAETWNDRPIEDALRAEVAALKAELKKYTDDLTREQAFDYFSIQRSSAADEVGVSDFDIESLHCVDAAIRAAREGAK